MSPQEYRSPWTAGWREETWARLNSPWDLIIIGGGITGAGILSLAVRSGVRALLLERGDFASGTASRSSKMVHGGLRYLKHMQIKLTRESVRERQQLLAAGPGLIEPLGFIYPIYEGERPSPWIVGVGLGIYTHLAPDAGDYRRLDEVDVGMMAPGLRTRGLERAYHYMDAQTDDARLVLRVLHDGLIAGQGRAAALNYASVIGLLKKGERVKGAAVRDETTGETVEAWAAGHEPVCHLDDLLLRYFRFGILLPDGGLDLLREKGPLLMKHLGWGDKRWAEEVERYAGFGRRRTVCRP